MSPSRRKPFNGNNSFCNTLTKNVTAGKAAKLDNSDFSKMCSICVGKGCDFCSSDYFKKPRCFDGNFSNLHGGYCPGDYTYAYEIDNAEARCSYEPAVDVVAIIIAVVITLSCCCCMCGILYFVGWGAFVSAISCGLVKERPKIYVDNGVHHPQQPGHYPMQGGMQGGMQGQYPMQGGMQGQYPMQGGMQGQYPMQGGMPGQYPMQGGMQVQYMMQGGMPGQYPMQQMPMGQMHPQQQHTSPGFGGGVQMQSLPVYAHPYTEGQNIPHAEVVHAIPVGLSNPNMLVEFSCRECYKTIQLPEAMVRAKGLDPATFCCSNAGLHCQAKPKN